MNSSRRITALLWALATFSSCASEPPAAPIEGPAATVTLLINS